MKVPVRTSDDPCVAAVEQGKDYRYACGQAKTQPFCSGSHTAEGAFAPIKRTAAERATVTVSPARPLPIGPCYGGSHKKKVFCHRLAAYHAVFDRGASGTWSPADPCHTATLKSMRQINRPLA